MKKRFPKFLFWFAIFFVVHFLVRSFLSRTVARLMAENSSHNMPVVLLLSLPLNLLSMPMRIVWFGFRTARFSEGTIEIMQIFNSLIWGSVLGMVALFASSNDRSGRQNG